mgnify:FL=1
MAPWGHEGCEARDLGQALEELLPSVGERLHRLREERLGRVGEQGGEGALHRRVGALDTERPLAKSRTNLQGDKLVSARD